jgi:hypothetical protein
MVRWCNALRTLCCGGLAAGAGGQPGGGLVLARHGGCDHRPPQPTHPQAAPPRRGTRAASAAVGAHYDDALITLLTLLTHRAM